MFQDKTEEQLLQRYLKLVFNMNDPDEQVQLTDAEWDEYYQIRREMTRRWLEEYWDEEQSNHLTSQIIRLLAGDELTWKSN